MNIYKLSALFVVSCACVAAQASSTIATHADPSAGTPPVFTVDTTNNVVTAGWTGSGLNMNFPFLSSSVSGLTMTVMNPIAILSSSTNFGVTTSQLGSGEIRYYTSNINAPEFQINFASAILVEPAGAFAGDLSGNNVTFSGSAISSLSGLLSNEFFSYSFANPGTFANGQTYTAALTASADVVPEPVTMVVLGAGVAGIASRRRKK